MTFLVAMRSTLNRKRSDVMSPTGAYTCVVPDEFNTAMTHAATIRLVGEYGLDVHLLIYTSLGPIIIMVIIIRIRMGEKLA